VWSLYLHAIRWIDRFPLPVAVVATVCIGLNLVLTVLRLAPIVAGATGIVGFGLLAIWFGSHAVLHRWWWFLAVAVMLGVAGILFVMPGDMRPVNLYVPAIATGAVLALALWRSR
jgi:hypothetical protein